MLLLLLILQLLMLIDILLIWNNRDNQGIVQLLLQYILHLDYNLDTGPDILLLDNVLLLKVCQNEQEQSWAQDYKFQLRVCDATGSAVLPAGTIDDLSQNKSGH